MNSFEDGIFVGVAIFAACYCGGRILGLVLGYVLGVPS